MRRFFKFIATTAAVILLGIAGYFGGRMYGERTSEDTTPPPATQETTPPRYTGSRAQPSSSPSQPSKINLSRLYFEICRKEIASDINQPLAGNSPEAQQIAVCIAERVSAAMSKR